MISLPDEQNPWFRRHADLMAGLITLLGFLARLWTASGTFLNPDEALHFRLANQPTALEAYKQSLTSLHPPLLILLLHFWRGLGTSELWLRMPSVIAGVAFCWLFYKWLTLVAGRLAGLVGLMLVALLPPQIMLSAEVRQYELLLALLAGSLYFLERAFAENSAGSMLASALFLYLATLTHYSAFLFAGALGVYALSKIFTRSEQHPRPSVIASWAVGQFGALALCLFLYRSHISHRGVGDSQIFQEWTNYLRPSSYFERGRDNFLFFVMGHSFGIFQFLFGQLAVGIVMGLAFLAGLVFLLRGCKIAENIVPSRRLAILLILPFALACAASLLHVYPYGGTRHVAFLTIPATAGVSLGIAYLAKGNLAKGLFIAACVVALCLAFGKQRRPRMDRADQSRAHVAAAMQFIERNVRPSELVLADYETDLFLGHYLCQQRPIALEPAPPGFEQYSCGGLRLAFADFRHWIFRSTTFPADWQRTVEAYNLRAGDTVWIVQAGWDATLPEELRRDLPEFHDLRFEAFGNNIKIFKLVVGQPMPASGA